jgi:hypothetical protein
MSGASLTRQSPSPEAISVKSRQTKHLPATQPQEVAGIGPEPESAKDAWGRIELFFATHLS